MNARVRKMRTGFCTRGMAGLGLLWMTATLEGQIVTNQTAPIVINDNTTATPYPSIIDLTQSALPGLVQNVSITVSGLTTPFAPGLGLLLVGPNSNAVVLLSGSGANVSGNSALTNSQMTFRDDAAGNAPANSPLVSGAAYKPTDNARLAFVAPAPTSNYSQTLTAAFVGSNANGLWSLYVLDSAAGPPSSVTSGIDSWSLAFFLGPAISSVGQVQLSEESMIRVNLNVADADGVVTNVTATIPQNPDMAMISTSLEGTNVTLTIAPSPFLQAGTNAVQVVATDDNGFAATNFFALNVQVEPQPYFYFGIPQQSVRAGTIFGPLAFSVQDHGFPFFKGTVRAVSDNVKLLPLSNILIQQTGNGTYTLTAFPQGAFEGGVNVTIIADDGVKTGTTTFNLIVQPPGNSLFAAPTSILIVPQAAGQPYPSTNTVSGLIGTVAKVQVTLFDITDPTPGGLSIMLVGPLGQQVMLMSAAGGNNALNNTTILLDDTGAPLPQSSQITSGIFAPTTYGTVASLPPPAPGAPYATTLAAFNGTAPNGDWKLYVSDTSSPAGTRGSLIAGGWQLSIQTAPTIPTIKDQFTDENVTARVTITVGDDQPGVPLTVTATGSKDLFKLPIEVSGSGATRTLSIVPQPYRAGTNTITVTATNAEGVTASAQFQMGVQFVPQPPLFISVPPDQSGCPDDLEPILFSVWSPQGSNLTVTASSPDNPTMVPAVQILMTGSDNGTNLYSLNPMVTGLPLGSATILISAADTAGLKSSAGFKLTVPTDCNFFGPATGPILIPPGPTNGLLAQGEAVPYPSVINVKGLEGLVRSVKVIMVGLTHSYPEDLRVLLVSPDNSRATILMGHAGAGGAASGLRLAFVEGAPEIPNSGALTDGTYSPADYSSGASLPLPAPAAPYSTNMAIFKGLSPNGDWKLYVLDDTYPDGGTIDGGWLLQLQLSHVPTLAMQRKGSTLDVSFTAQTNTIYGIQSSVDLLTWTDAGTVTAGSDGFGKFSIQIDATAQARFYRVVGQ